MNKRKITKLNKLKFKPFDRYGKPIKGWSWHNISFNKKTNFGTYISKLEPGTRTLPHIHSGYEEFLILDGECAVGDVGNAGACVSKHSTDRTAHIPKVTTFVPPSAAAGWTWSLDR